MTRHLTVEDWAILALFCTIMAAWIADTVRTTLSIGKRPSQPPKGRTEVL